MATSDNFSPLDATFLVSLLMVFILTILALSFRGDASALENVGIEQRRGSDALVSLALIAIVAAIIMEMILFSRCRDKLRLLFILIIFSNCCAFACFFGSVFLSHRLLPHFGSWLIGVCCVCFYAFLVSIIQKFVD
ncbi:hypothetical protein EG68_01819 [Paragonimus skrjabini miyazakii]|uniref:Uncharacterized protein n=1 Tax=Paragonimus skrjabini miyazakii TaxID=59628 RepID=A0A8S9YZX0_9TREM|nr:hypothetical protein EG68_01819 [Paragonimus skrjabini miyazakii]